MRKHIETMLVMLVLLVSTSVIAQAANHQVAMLNTGSDGASQMVFEPDFIEAAVGDTIEFVVTDVLHQPTSVYVPEGGNTWAAEVSTGVKVTLNKAGVWVFKCKTHATLGMMGVIQVGGSKANLDDAKEAADEMLEEVAMNQDRMTVALGKVK